MAPGFVMHILGDALFHSYIIYKKYPQQTYSYIEKNYIYFFTLFFLI